MAQGVRPQPGRTDPLTNARRGRTRSAVALLLLLLSPACSRTPAPTGDTVRQTGLKGPPGDGARVVAEVLETCHGPLRGQMADLALTIEAKGARYTVSASLPDRLRTAGPNGAYLLLGAEAWRLDGEAARDAEPTARDWLVGMRNFVDAVALGPLYRAVSVSGDGGDAGYGLVDAAGRQSRLFLRPGEARPRALTVGEHTIDCQAFLRTSATWMVSSATHPSLGRAAVTFERCGVIWSPEFFARPAARPSETSPGDATPRIVLPGQAGGETRSPVPVAGRAAALQLLVVDDPGGDAPGGWAARAAAFAPLYAELERQNQRSAGFPMLFADGERPLLAAPFRQRPGGPSFTPPTGWEVRAWPDQELLVVYPPEGDFAARRDEGVRQLRDALASTGRRAAGPIVVQPFLHLQDGEPTAAKLTAPVVRCSVALAPQ